MNNQTTRRPLRLVVRTPYELVLDLPIRHTSVAARHGRIDIDVDTAALLAPLAPGDLVVQATDGSEACIPVGWGLVTFDGSEVRVTVSEARLERAGSLPLAV